MAKSFRDLVEKTSNANSRDIAAKRTEELLKEYKMVTWLDLYNFLYNKAHDFPNLGKFNWNAEIRVLNGETGEEYSIEPTLSNDDTAKLFCNPALIIKVNND
jgi:hypothetical protein